VDEAPFMLTVGVDVPKNLHGDELDVYIQARSQIHMPESVESHPGFMRGTVYQRVGPAEGTNDWPETLTVLEIDSREAADGFVDRLLKGPRGYPAYRTWTTAARIRATRRRYNAVSTTGWAPRRRLRRASAGSSTHPAYCGTLPALPSWHELLTGSQPRRAQGDSPCTTGLSSSRGDHV
jgi:hypothetical protein